ncbi:hypothetical protein CBS101457_002231 [Exobasidium rhododendri]|nr:hypothetical protein CBS101457_002231 [Exobasidium rhododendri]
MSSRSGGHPPSGRHHRPPLSDDYVYSPYDEYHRQQQHRVTYDYSPGGPSSYYDKYDRGEPRYQDRPIQERGHAGDSGGSRRFSRYYGGSMDGEPYRYDRYEEEDRRAARPAEYDDRTRSGRDRPTSSKKETSTRSDMDLGRSRDSKSSRGGQKNGTIKDKGSRRKERYDSDQDDYEGWHSTRKSSPLKADREDRRERKGKVDVIAILEDSWSSEEGKVRLPRRENGKSKVKAKSALVEEDDAFERLASSKVERSHRDRGNSSIRDHSRRRDEPDTDKAREESVDRANASEQVIFAATSAPASPNGYSGASARSDQLQSAITPLEASLPPPPDDRPASPPPPPPTPPPLSFKDVLLPHDFTKAENEALLPRTSRGKVLRPFKVMNGSALPMGKEGESKEKGDAHDPRRKGKKQKAIDEIGLLQWKWDPRSTRAKPLPPPRAVVVSNIAAWKTLVELKRFFSTYGKIEEAELFFNNRSGASLGILYLLFQQDYDEDLRLKPDAVEGLSQRGDLVARDVVAKANGMVVLEAVIKVELDDDNRSRYIETHKEAMRTLYPPPVPKAKVAIDGSSERVGPSSTEVAVPSPLPTGPKKNAPAVVIPRGPRHSVPSSAAPFRGGYQGGTLHRNSFVNGHGKVSSPYQTSTTTESHHNSSLANLLHQGAADEDLRSNGHVHYQKPAQASGAHGGSNAANGQHSSVAFDDEDVALIKLLVANKHPYYFVPRDDGGIFTYEAVSRLFGGCYPLSFQEDRNGWYVIFKGSSDAARLYHVFGERLLHGRKLNVEIRDPRNLEGLLARKMNTSSRASTAARGHLQVSPKKTAIARRPAKTTWTDEELLDDAKLLLLRELGEMFIRDIKARVIKPFLKDFTRPEAAGGKVIYAPTKVVEDELDEEEEEEASDSDVEMEEEQQESPLFEKEEEEEEEEEEEKAALPRSQTERMLKKGLARGRLVDQPDDVVVNDVAEDTGKSKTGKASKAKYVTKPKKNGQVTQADREVEASIPGGDDEPPVTVRVKVKAKKSKKESRQRSPSPDPFAMGIAEDGEDLYYVKLALERMRVGMTANDIMEEGRAVLEGLEGSEAMVGVNGLPRHVSGSARTEGFYRIPPAEKALHLPDRNRAVVDPTSAIGLASARDNRADSRRFVQGIEQHKKETATDTDILKFNQLRSRKKQLKFAKSPIHDWGLYAMELIPAGDMVIEYVGEIVRQQIADQREKMYERQGNFSTYLFRVDDDVVVDATKKGNIARLMNHCCTPNCNAKILTLNGEKRIVLYAKNTIYPGQELTYDYKFQATGDEDDAIACLCGSDGCRRFL